MSPADELEALQLGPDPDKLERYHRQQLSAMLDGELAQDQARFLRRRLQHDAELSACFERWQVCGDVLRGRQVSLLPPDFADRVGCAIEADGVPATPAGATRRPRLLRWGGGAALAASVAMAALFVGRPGMPVDDGLDGMPRPVADTTPHPAPVLDATADAGALVDGADAATGLTAVAAVAAMREAPARRNAGRNPAGQPARAATLVAAQGATTAGVDAALPEPAGTVRQRSAMPAAHAARFAAASVDGMPALAVPPRAWPRASALTAGSSFSVRHGAGFTAPAWPDAGTTGPVVLPRFPVDADEAPARAWP